jgi:hypothetical protein
VVADGGESVAKFATLSGGVADSVGREQRKMQRTGESDGVAIARFFFTLEVALQFDVDIAGTKDSDQLIDATSSFFKAALLQGCG